MTNLLLRHRVVHRVIAPGVATEDAFRAEINSFENAPLFDSLNHVGGAGGLVTAFLPQHRREGVLVDFDGEDENLFEQFVQHC